MNDIGEIEIRVAVSNGAESNTRQIGSGSNRARLAHRRAKRRHMSVRRNEAADADRRSHSGDWQLRVAQPRVAHDISQVELQVLVELVLAESWSGSLQVSHQDANSAEELHQWAKDRALQKVG